MNKSIKITLNILIGVAAVGLFLSLIVFISSVQYVNREVEDPVKTEMGVFEYKLKHKAFGEITSSYFTDRMYSMEAEEGLEKTYLMGDYANTAFLALMYEEKGDEAKAQACREKLEALRGQLEEYADSVEEIDRVLSQYSNQ